ncbi:hypothetical protein EJ08DRAFT_187520 [Tothia fuscella]|uniref:Uncharacterized protein n=1 Tax=Tothia fuscella TaxID=1048955 RepID=A0A9P4TZI4_9PEZI|nr:hypothetical protein EJ08DRAFT_187520 [Tothia fuscella]
MLGGRNRYQYRRCITIHQQVSSSALLQMLPCPMGTWFISPLLLSRTITLLFRTSFFHFPLIHNQFPIFFLPVRFWVIIFLVL